MKAQGIQQYLLEVLQHNDVAVGIYKKAGFTVSRELDYFVNEANEITPKPMELAPRYSIREIELSDIQDAWSFYDFQPSWQNSIHALKREPSHFILSGAFAEDQLVGFGVIEPDTGDIPHLAVQKEHRRMGIASAILKTLLQQNRHSAVRIINTESAYEPMAALLKNHGLVRKGRQYEMILSL